MNEAQRRRVGKEFRLSEESERVAVQAMFVTKVIVLALDEMGDLWLVTYDPDADTQTEIYLGEDGQKILEQFEITAKLLRRGDA